MKKHIYLLLPLLTLHPTLATQKITTSTIIASTLVLSRSSYDKKRSLRLHQAVEQNNTTDALQLINNPQVDINAKVDVGTDWWEKGFTPLIRCCWRGYDALQIAQALLKRKEINVNLQNNYGYTPLIMCAWRGYDALQIAQDLLKHQHINVNLGDNGGWTPLIHCANEGDDALKIAQALLKHQHINVNLPDNKGWTPLIWCADKGYKSLHLAQELLKHKEIKVNLRDKYSRTPLIMCCWKGDNSLHIAQALLEHQDINVNLQNNKGRTPLDSIIYWIKKNKENYKYVHLWNLLVAQGGILDKCKVDYENLEPSDFNEPHKVYVRLIKQNPPINLNQKQQQTKQHE